MKTIKSIKKLILVFGFCAFACGIQQSTKSPDYVESQVNIVLNSAKTNSANEPHQLAVSVIDSIMLQIKPTNAEPQILGQKLTGKEQFINFPIKVKPGQTEFSASIFSNNGQKIYAGQVTSDLQRDGFQVNLLLESVQAVMEIFPDTLTVPYEPGGNKIRIRNRGKAELKWRGKIVGLNNDCTNCLFLEPDTGSVTSNDSMLVQLLFEWSQPGNIFNIIFESDVGHAEIFVEYTGN